MTRVSLFVLSMAMMSTSASAHMWTLYACNIPALDRVAVVYLGSGSTVSVEIARRDDDGRLTDYGRDSILTAGPNVLTYVGSVDGRAATFQLSEDGHMTGTLTLAGFGPLPRCSGGLSPPPDTSESDWNAPVPEFPRGARP